MQFDPVAVPVLVQVDRHLVANVVLRPVADHVDLLVVKQLALQIVQVGQEQSRDATLLWLTLGEEDLTGPPMGRP